MVYRGKKKEKTEGESSTLRVFFRALSSKALLMMSYPLSGIAHVSFASGCC